MWFTASLSKSTHLKSVFSFSQENEWEHFLELYCEWDMFVFGWLKPCVAFWSEQPVGQNPTIHALLLHSLYIFSSSKSQCPFPTLLINLFPTLPFAIFPLLSFAQYLVCLLHVALLVRGNTRVVRVTREYLVWLYYEITPIMEHKEGAGNIMFIPFFILYFCYSLYACITDTTTNHI